MDDHIVSVLLIEDNPGDARLLIEILREADARDVKVDHVETLASGVEKLDGQRYDLVLLDLTLPDARGLKTFSRLHERHRTTPVVVLTGLEDDAMALQAVRDGAQDFLVKGKVDGARLVQAMRYAIERQRLLEKTRTETLSREQLRVTDTQVVANPDKFDSKTVAGYRLCRILGEGSMATVYLAEKEGGADHRQVALKIMKLESLGGNNRQPLLERFFREAEVAASVRHENVVEIIEFGMAEERSAPYIVMEYVNGTTLQQCYREKNKFDYFEKAHILRQVASALAAIHERDICHRDVKPSNIMLDDEFHVKLTDFGIALIPGSDLTIDMHLIGSPAYMAPEAFRSPKITPAADIFSLGILAYELFLERHPFDGETIAQLAHDIQFERPREPRKLDPSFPLPLQHMLAQMLKKEPEQRYSSTRQIIEALEQFTLNRTRNSTAIIGSFRQRWLRSDWR